MGCCGQSRATLRNILSATTNREVTQHPIPRQHAPVPILQANRGTTRPAQNYSVRLRYLENSPILVRGPATGREYRFSRANPDQPVDARDAEALLRTRFFRRN